mmetsp:Transcript_45403/g.74836  ORF Transcript_45403/g.74836 Transcript_45403/m.74836 type:complete len:81 (-) Transcript_45403:157-399(-)
MVIWMERFLKSLVQSWQVMPKNYTLISTTFWMIRATTFISSIISVAGAFREYTAGSFQQSWHCEGTGNSPLPDLVSKYKT